MVFVGALIGSIGLLGYLITHSWIKRITFLENDDSTDLKLRNIFDSLMVVKYWKLYGLIKSKKLQPSQVNAALKILRWGLISMVILIVGLAIQITGMLGKGGKFG